MKLVLIESPLKGKTPLEVLRNITYAQRALRDSINHGEAPFAGHLLYTQVLSDADPNERALGILLHQAWLRAVDEVVFYMDYGMSPGMDNTASTLIGKVFSFRRIGENPPRDPVKEMVESFNLKEIKNV